jgi:hypothetical protein
VKHRAELGAEGCGQFRVRACHDTATLADQRRRLDPDPLGVHVRRRVRASYEGGDQAALAELKFRAERFS